MAKSEAPADIIAFSAGPSSSALPLIHISTLLFHYHSRPRNPSSTDSNKHDILRCLCR